MRKYKQIICKMSELSDALNKCVKEGFDIEFSTLKYESCNDVAMAFFVCYTILPDNTDLEKIADSYNPFYKD